MRYPFLHEEVPASHMCCQILLYFSLGNSLQLSECSTFKTHSPKNATLFLDQSPRRITLYNLQNQSVFQRVVG